MCHFCSRALECGYDLIDTAQARDWYDEVAVGYALRNFEMENDKRAFIISKLDPRLNGFESALEGALFCYFGRGIFIVQIEFCVLVCLCSLRVFRGKSWSPVVSCMYNFLQKLIV